MTGSGRSQEIEELFGAGESYAETLLRENEALRAQIVEREAQRVAAAAGPAGRLPVQLLDVISTLEQQRSQTARELHSAENKNKHLAERCVEVQDEYETLGNLYVATHQMHSTLDFELLLRTLVEVAINLVGAEVLAVYVFDEARRKLVALASEGAEVGAFPAVEVGQGTIGSAVAKGEIHSIDASGSHDLKKPIICIPFRRDRDPIGAISIYQLMPQKTNLTALDHELFKLLAGHAATALYTAQLYSASKRKLDTFEGFLGLMRQGPSAEAASPTALAGTPSRSTP
jgi:hypothetical protein